ncbi:hypothetical protein DFH28DRAFT_1122695 [Melampsora americana]|nr:hypothetical protein DFH28DRAFT_1122695 [Melampsora americana]
MNVFTLAQYKTEISLWPILLSPERTLNTEHTQHTLDHALQTFLSTSIRHAEHPIQRMLVWALINGTAKPPSDKSSPPFNNLIDFMDPPNRVFAPFRVTRGQKRARADSAGSEGSAGATKPSRNRAKVNPGFNLLSHIVRDDTKISDDGKRDKRKDQANQNNACNTKATQKKNKNSSSSSKITQLDVPPPNKYSALKLVTLRSIMKPSGVKGIGAMKKDELLQLCLLYNPEIPDIPSSLPPPARSVATKSNDQSRLQRTRTFQASLDQEDMRESSDEDQPHVRTRRRALHFSSPERNVTSEEEMEDLPDATPSNPAPVRLAVSKGKQKQTSNEVPTPCDFPSRERGTALPRPRPTNLSRDSAVSRTRKFSIPDCDDDNDSDWKISSDEDSQGDEDSEENDDSFEQEKSSSSSQNRIKSNQQEKSSKSSSSSQNRIKSNQQENSSSSSQNRIESNLSMEEDSIDTSRNEEPEGPASRIERILGPQITQLNNAQANQDESVDLQQQVQHLSQAVRDLAMLYAQQNTASARGASSGKLVEKSKKKSSAEFLGRIRSHIRKLMGLRENEEIPASATRAQMSSWKLGTTKQEMLSSFNMNQLPPQIENQSDPRFPYKGGPGGEFSNPQELLIMWTMMNRVGVSSFRPVWEEAVSCRSNAFLWRLATAIFIQLVKCGQYDNITPDDAKFDVVFAAIKKHARQSLQRIVRERNEWPAAKIRASKKHIVRQQRVRGLRMRRKAIALRSGLPLFCNVIEQCCSDDETDLEDDPSGSQKKIFRIKKLEWRSTSLQTLLLSLDAHRSKEKDNSPKGTPGVRPTERVRDSTLLSRMEPPPGLPIDCYDAEWLKKVEEHEPEQYEALQVDPTPIIRSFEVRAYDVLKIKRV